MRSKIEKYIRDWETNCYFDGLPEESPIEIEHLVPSYKKICISIMKNDVQLQYLGFGKKKCLVYNELKRIEINNRTSTKSIQLKLPL